MVHILKGIRKSKVSWDKANSVFNNTTVQIYKTMQNKVWKDQSHSIVDLCVKYSDSKIVNLVSVLRTLDRTSREL